MLMKRVVNTRDFNKIMTLVPLPFEHKINSALLSMD